MLKQHKSIFSATLLLHFFTKVASAQITNPAIGMLGDSAEEASSGRVFLGYFVYVWNSMIAIGGLLVLVFFLWGAFEWITSQGDSGKLQQARNRMINAVIGLIILVASYTIIGFLSGLLFGTQFNILNPTFFVPN